ncbi:MAG TPA: TraR/DksA C4-type zinc finger protein [Acidimicrobiales bacterium]|nr:TraR/DksA C4-type zinc finger protein [Acidimicrobiales bacterium]
MTVTEANSERLPDAGWQTAIRERLEEEIAQAQARADAIWSEREALASDTPVDVQFDEESGEGAGTHVERDRDFALYQQALARADEAREALARLDAGTYGRCQNCGEQIAAERLEALPTAATCVRCKSGGLLTRLGQRR